MEGRYRRNGKVKKNDSFGVTVWSLCNHRQLCTCVCSTVRVCVCVCVCVSELKSEFFCFFKNSLVVSHSQVTHTRTVDNTLDSDTHTHNANQLPVFFSFFYSFSPCEKKLFLQPSGLRKKPCFWVFFAFGCHYFVTLLNFRNR